MTLASIDVWIERIGRRGTAQPQEGRVMIANCPHDFTRRLLASGRVAIVAPAPPAGEAQALVMAAVRGLSRYYRLLRDPAFADRGLADTPDALAERVAAAAPAPAGRPGSLQAVEPADAAMINGWDPEDLTGTGTDGDPGARGGTSPISGLTLAEMALSVPPADWQTSRATAYPWAHPDWTPPPGFKPRRMPAKASADASDAEAGRLAPPPEPEPQDAPPAARNEAAASLPTVLLPELDSDDPRAGYPEEHWLRAVAIVREAWPDPMATAPTRAKISARLRRENLPKLDKSELGQRQLAAMMGAVYPNLVT